MVLMAKLKSNLLICLVFLLSIFLVSCGGSGTSVQDNNGNELVWSLQVGGENGITDGYGISIDQNNNIYITGNTGVGISGESQVGNRDYFIAKYNESGVLLWTRQVGATSGNTFGYGVSTDQNSNLYITGNTDVGISGESQVGNTDYFVAKYTENGTLLWTRQVGAAGGDTYGLEVSTDQNNNIYITGNTGVGISGESQVGNRDYFVAKYTESGTLLWTRQVGATSGNTFGYGVSTDQSNNLYITGNTDVGISGESQLGNGDYFVAKYTESGVLLWTRQVGAAGGNTDGRKISTDQHDNTYITGYTDVGISGESQVGNTDYFVAKYTESGTLLWTRQVGAESGNTYGLGISTDQNNDIYITGGTEVGISGNSQVGNTDYFVTQYTESGTLLWTRQVGGEDGVTGGLGVSTDQNNNIYITGITNVGISGESQMGNRDYFIAKY